MTGYGSSERWLPVVGHPDYRVSDHGRVWSNLSGRELKPTLTEKGYLRVGLRVGTGRNVHRRVHRLVLEAFVGPCPPKHEGCHGNDDPVDNRLVNLRWGTSAENTMDSVRAGRHVTARRTHCPKGHEYTEANTYVSKRGGRHCRECHRLRTRRARARA